MKSKVFLKNDMTGVEHFAKTCKRIHHGKVLVYVAIIKHEALIRRLVTHEQHGDILCLDMPNMDVQARYKAAAKYRLQLCELQDIWENKLLHCGDEYWPENRGFIRKKPTRKK